MDKLKGTLTAMVTPFDQHGRLSLGALPAYLDFQRQGGIAGVVVCGTNGEGVSLAASERMRLLEAVMELRASMTVVAGTGAASVQDAVDLTVHAGRAGADAVLVLPPFFFKNPTARGIADYYRRVLDASSIPVLLYSIPQQTMIAITDEVLDLLAGHPRLAGLKDSQGDWNRTRTLLRERRDLLVLPGSDDILLKAVQAGAVGSISGTANAFPELVSAVSRMHAQGRGEAAQARLDAAKSILLQYPLIAAAKSVLARRGVDRMWVRPPLVDLTPAQEEEMLGRLEAAGVL